MTGRAINPAPPQRHILVPLRVAQAVAPSADRSQIPARVTLKGNAPPFAGELREEQASVRPVVIPPGQGVVLCTLRRAWTYVGFGVNPGDGGGTLLDMTAELQIMTGAGFNPSTIAVAVPAARQTAFGAFALGARAQLVVRNTSESFASGVLGVIWGMSER